jgi:hypothetical protein
LEVFQPKTLDRLDRDQKWSSKCGAPQDRADLNRRPNATASRCNARERSVNVQWRDVMFSVNLCVGVQTTLHNADTDAELAGDLVDADASLPQFADCSQTLWIVAPLLPHELQRARCRPIERAIAALRFATVGDSFS